jgi:hypothetical protein
MPNDQRVLMAQLAEPLASCPGDEPEPGFAHWRLNAPGFETGELGIAVLATTPFPRDGWRTDLDRDGAREDYRACTSSEGVHLTVWAGEALRSRRVWHHYHYLGYDVEPNCVEADFSEQ